MCYIDLRCSSADGGNATATASRELSWWSELDASIYALPVVSNAQKASYGTGKVVGGVEVGHLDGHHAPPGGGGGSWPAPCLPGVRRDAMLMHRCVWALELRRYETSKFSALRVPITS